MSECFRVFIGVGSNLEDPLDQVRRAIDEGLAKLPRTSMQSCSRWYRTRPWGGIEQPDFINAVVALDTHLSPDDLFSGLQQIEQRHARRRDECRWGPRTLDLDLLLYSDWMIQTPGLTVPHPRMAERAFVLIPLAELVAADWYLPGLGPIQELCSRVAAQGVVPVA